MLTVIEKYSYSDFMIKNINPSRNIPIDKHHNIKYFFECCNGNKIHKIKTEIFDGYNAKGPTIKGDNTDKNLPAQKPLITKTLCDFDENCCMFFCDFK